MKAEEIKQFYEDFIQAGDKPHLVNMSVPKPVWQVMEVLIEELQQSQREAFEAGANAMFEDSIAPRITVREKFKKYLESLNEK